MITETYHYLSSDDQLCTLLGHIPQERKVKIFLGRPQAETPLQEKDGKFIDYPCIVYNVTPLTQSVVTSEYRIQATLITSDELELSNISKRLIEILDFNKPNIERPSHHVKGRTILFSQLLSGGSLEYHENEKLFEQIQYFLLKLKN